MWVCDGGVSRWEGGRRKEWRMVVRREAKGVVGGWRRGGKEAGEKWRWFGVWREDERGKVVRRRGG